MTIGGTARLLGAAAVLAACAAAPAGAQRQVLSVANSDYSNGDPDQTSISTVAGVLASTDADGTDARALTDFGVNKVYARGTDGAEVYGSSAWLDTFTVAGAAGSTVNMRFSFTVDGAVSGLPGDNGAEWNFKVLALRGGGWTLNGSGGSEDDFFFRRLYTGDDYDTLILKNVNASRVTMADLRDFDGFYNHANAGGEPGAIQSQVWRQTDALGEYYEVTNPSGTNVVTSKYYATFVQRSVNNGPPQTVLYTNTAAGGPAALTARNNIAANYSLLASGGLCDDDGCSGLTQNMTRIDPFTFTLDFNLLAGSTFTLASWMYADDVGPATIDLFNTARVTGVTVSDGGTLTSASGALQALPGGGYGYPAAAVEAAVPEPATWAMMIAGFGVIGGALRRRQPATAAA